MKMLKFGIACSGCKNLIQIRIYLKTSKQINWRNLILVYWGPLKMKLVIENIVKDISERAELEIAWEINR